MWVLLFGGIGVFLLGMGLLTEGLRRFAGDGLRRFLQRFAGNRYSAAATGAVTTALIQSSSATSLLTIGLVGAGLVALPNAIAILIGANVGTTATAYLVAFVGLKFSISAYAMALIGAGALGGILIRGRWGAVAHAFAGLGLLFLGIDFMREAAGGVVGSIDLHAWAGGGFFGALVLVLLGILMTVLVQSSSAAMATTLAALDAGAIGLTDGAYLAIGQNIGTTVTAGLGVIGASVDAKRTALAHVTFNVGTAIPALALALPLLRLTEWIAGGDAVVALAVFHTVFNVLGLVIFLPLVTVLARFVTRAVPERPKDLVVNLDRASLQSSASAEGVVDVALEAMRKEATHLVRSRLQSSKRPSDWPRRLAALRASVEETRLFMAAARAQGHTTRRVGAQVRALDHLMHIVGDLDEAVDVAGEHVHDSLSPFLVDFVGALEAPTASDIDEKYESLPKVRRALRRRILQRVEEDTSFHPVDAARLLDALHWMDRIAWHMRRLLQSQRTDTPPAPDQAL